MSTLHTTPLPPELVREALRLLATGRAADRRAASQLLASGWQDHEDARRNAVPEVDWGDGYDEMAEPDPPAGEE